MYLSDIIEPEDRQEAVHCTATVVNKWGNGTKARMQTMPVHTYIERLGDYKVPEYRQQQILRQLFRLALKTHDVPLWKLILQAAGGKQDEDWPERWHLPTITMLKKHGPNDADYEPLHP